MIDLTINGIVLRTKTPALGDTGDITVLGKKLTEWVGSALRTQYKVLQSSPVINMADTIKANIDKTRPYTVILFSDTPLISIATITDAVAQARESNARILRFPRGYIFSTDFIFSSSTLYLHEKEGTGEFQNVKDGQSLAEVTEVLRKRIIKYHLSNGVRIVDLKNTYIDSTVSIDPGVTIEPYNFVRGTTRIKKNAHILPGNYIENCIIGENARVDSSRLYNSSVGDGTTVGPFAYVRPNSVIGKSCRIGDFVELKNCVIGDGTKVSHLTYIGDAELGKECNVGCGVVFANYDGKNKYRSMVGNRVFLGSNSNVIAPVTIADGSFIAAGSTVTDSVPAHALAVARARQRVIPNWKNNPYCPLPVLAPETENKTDTEEE